MEVAMPAAAPIRPPVRWAALLGRRWRGAVGALLALGIAIRLLLVALGWPVVNSDEGTMGVMALHIAYTGAHPIFFYGQAYMGALEAYLAAILFLLFGASPLTLRLATILLYALFVFVVGLLARRVYGAAGKAIGKRVALLTLLFLALGSQTILFRQVLVTGGYPETSLFGALGFLLAVGAALSFDLEHPARRRGRRLAAYGAWVVVATVGIWSNFVILPFLAGSGLVLLLGCWRELRRAALLAALVGGVVAVPLAVYAIAAPPDRNPIRAVLHGDPTKAALHTSYAALLAQGAAGTALISLPRITGEPLLCPEDVATAWPFPAHPGPAQVACAAAGGLWSLAVVALWVVAVWQGIGALRVLRRAPAPWGFGARRRAVRLTTHLALLGSGAALLAIYVFSTAPALAPDANTRYLAPLLLTAPAVLAPLLAGAGGVPAGSVGARGRLAGLVGRPSPALRPAAIALLVGALLLGTVDAFHATAGARVADADHVALIAYLARAGSTRVYSDYWACGWINFESREHVICGVLDGQLRPGADRYRPYRAIVAADPHPTFVFWPASAQDATFARTRAGAYSVTSVAGYHVYQPLPKVG